MEPSPPHRRALELDRAGYAEFRDRIVRVESEGVEHEPRAYPGYPRVALDRVRARPLVSLDGALAARRSVRALGTAMPQRRALSRLLRFGHGATGEGGRGPAPSAGGLQALELFAVAFEPSWLEPGVYHYDRAGHHLSRIVPEASRA